MIKDDVLEPATGPMPWVSPLLAFPKPGPNGKTVSEASQIRLVADSTLSNTAIIREHRVTMTPEELTVEANGSDLYSVVDLTEGYSQIELDEESRQITVVSSHLGPLRYKRLTMGICSAAEIFQKALEKALAGLKGVRNLWDDIFVHGREDDGSHDENLKNLLERLEEKGLTLSTKKAQIRQPEVKFFGLIFSKRGIKVSHDFQQSFNNCAPDSKPHPQGSPLSVGRGGTKVS
ncbi:Retrovirus-related Pol poly from transposon [Brachionus plicatilis]|uniref:Retrovirus-related Pol poly from transposon n=1 Tax=Brachionus plicatilis TaxID=10195 RepID=A0A3M7PEP4_BRAPC|nr:Retrovirus-related Pol poly from transposon [Brachionus plicatilis]